MQVGEVRVAADDDFMLFKQYADEDTGWKRQYSKRHTTVWTRDTPQTYFKMIKVLTYYPDIKPSLLYDVLHDPDYRKEWDAYMIEGSEFCCLNPNNDIGYYAVRCPSPLKNRDFVLQRSWLATPDEYFIISHSTYHDSYPPRKGYIRGITFLTGYLVRPKESGCSLAYIAQTDPRGSLPKWIVNKITHIFAPSLIKKIREACYRYDEWKSSHSPQLKPWLYPEQLSLPRVNLAETKEKIYNGDLSEEEEEEERTLNYAGELEINLDLDCGSSDNNDSNE